MAGKAISRRNLAHRDSEKVTINLVHVDLGQIDLLVKGGFYASRSDFIRTAIRQQLLHHGEALQQAMSRQTLSLGLQHYGRADLEAARAAGQVLHLRVLGLASIARDVSAKLARDTIGSLLVLGALDASAEVKAALADRMR